MQKPSFDEWVIASDIVAQQMRHVHAVYHERNELPMKAKIQGLIDRLSRVFTPLTEIHGFSFATPSTALEDSVSRCLILFSEILTMLPFVSTDMQRLLQSSWAGECNGRRAADIFKGKPGTQGQGISSGLPDDGGLPEVMAALIERERYGTSPRPGIGKGRSDAQLAQYIRELSGLPLSADEAHAQAQRNRLRISSLS